MKLPPLVVSRNITGCRPAIGGEKQTRYTGKYYPPPCRVPQYYGVFCNAKYRGGVTEVTEGLKQYSSVFERFLYSFLAVSRSITRYFSSHYRRYLNLLSCRVPQYYWVFCSAKYRGSVRRTRGLNTIVEQKYETLPPVVSRNITGYRLAIGGRTSTLHRKVLSSSPVFCDAKYRGGVTKRRRGYILSKIYLIVFSTSCRRDRNVFVDKHIHR